MATITAEIGTTGEAHSLELTGNARADMASAVQAEHYCSDGGCDIREALEYGFSFVAGSLLSSATECPLVGAIAEHYGINLGGDLRELEDWEEWRAHFRQYARRCRACNGFTYASFWDEPSACAHCLAEDLEPRRISDASARRIASEWHAGQASALYSFASCGAISEALAGEISESLKEQEEGSEEAEELGELLFYLAGAEARGPVEGWSALEEWSEPV